MPRITFRTSSEEARSKGRRASYARYRPVDATSTSTDSGSESISDPPRQISEVNGHRTKRIKTEDTTDCRGIYEPEALAHPHSSEPQMPKHHGEQGANSMDVDRVNRNGDAQVDISALASNAAESALESYHGLPDLPLPTHSEEALPNNPRQTTASVEKGVRSRSHTSVPEIDLSSAPSDPTELAIWVAKQISNFREEGRDSMDMDEDEDRRKLMQHPPGMYNRRFDEDNDPIKVAERERVREENRARKKKWRESNTERSKRTSHVHRDSL